MLTAQVLVDMLNHGYFSLQRANVLVFDECHHILSKRGGGGHAYAKIMDVYNNMPKGVVQMRGRAYKRCRCASATCIGLDGVID